MISRNLHFPFFTVILNLSLTANVAKAYEFSLPVGKQTLTIRNGFNYHGIRLHPQIAANGMAAQVSSGSTTITVTSDVSAALSPGTKYVFEVNSGDAIGAVIEILSFDQSTNSVTLESDISADFSTGDQFAIRPAVTLAQIFGENNSANLDSGAFGLGNADQIWIPKQTGGFTKIYYDLISTTTFQSAWVNADTDEIIDPHSFVFYYPDGLMFVGDGTANNTFSISGTVKTTPTNFSLKSSFNYLSSIYPEGSDLATMFGPANEAGLDPGFGGTGGADVVWIPDGLGGFDKFYYDEFLYDPTIGDFVEGWARLNTYAEVDPATISFDFTSGMIIINNGAPQAVEVGTPNFYDQL